MSLYRNKKMSLFPEQSICQLCVNSISEFCLNCEDSSDGNVMFSCGVTILTCCHLFHKHCLKSFQSKGKNYCPICKKPIVIFKILRPIIKDLEFPDEEQIENALFLCISNMQSAKRKSIQKEHLMKPKRKNASVTNHGEPYARSRGLYQVKNEWDCPMMFPFHLI